jgi:hypothetical protein
MRDRKYSFLIPILLGSLVLAGTIALWPASNASAQCGSQASSCKNCHEVQGQDPVNADGTGWHQSHAFGDFCYLCHGGNNQSMDQAEAHAGMVPPLSDVQAGCQSCHPADLMEKAQVYATALGVEVGTGGSAPSGGTTPGENPAPVENPPAEPPPPSLVMNEPGVIDYNQQYAETVLGERSINWGNTILVVLIVLVSVGGGAFVYWNERKLRGLPLWTKDERRRTEAAAPIALESYPTEVLALVPQIAQLNPIGLHALKHLLKNPEETNELLHSLSHLDPELLRHIRALDRDSRALLMALAGD